MKKMKAKTSHETHETNERKQVLNKKIKEMRLGNQNVLSEQKKAQKNFGHNFPFT